MTSYTTDNTNYLDEIKYTGAPSSPTIWNNIYSAPIVTEITLSELHDVFRNITENTEKEYPGGDPFACLGYIKSNDARFQREEDGDLMVRYGFTQIHLPATSMANTKNELVVQLSTMMTLARIKEGVDNPIDSCDCSCN